ncbi:hypothetical protein [Rhizosaccharibacter radicis]|uniref:Phage protein n=1 Tax=Rhizosaccharibacter radicis TaxID=2782605 RepID=A0ABT1VW00_9PROT|nr:hypothetical protein [Acetobacteraceae bacterium KSS12]
MAKRISASLSRFAHLSGIKPASAPASAAASEDDKSKAGKTADEGDDQDEEAKGTGAAAEDDDGDQADPNDDDKGRQGKKGKRADSDEEEGAEDEGDDETDAQDEKDEKAAAARRRERARCAAIFASPAAAGRPAAAAELAFGTTMPRQAAIRTLSALASTDRAPSAEAPKRDNLRSRMAGADTPKVGTDGTAKPKTGAAGFAEQMKRANAIRHGDA